MAPAVIKGYGRSSLCCLHLMKSLHTVFDPACPACRVVKHSICSAELVPALECLTVVIICLSAACADIVNMSAEVEKAPAGITAVIMNMCCGGAGTNTKPFVLFFSLLSSSEHQAALLQLKRECKEELEKLQVSTTSTRRSFTSKQHF